MLTINLTWLLLGAFLVYFYRDLLPLAFFGGSPRDYFQGNLLWIEIAILFGTAVLLPLVIPRTYTPVDPNVNIFRLQRKPR